MLLILTFKEHYLIFFGFPLFAENGFLINSVPWLLKRKKKAEVLIIIMLMVAVTLTPFKSRAATALRVY